MNEGALIKMHRVCVSSNTTYIKAHFHEIGVGVSREWSVEFNAWFM